jgi:hypothetical protein
VVTEKEELDAYIQRLTEFLQNAKHENKPTEMDRALLERQHYIMLEYSRVLGQRIKNFRQQEKPRHGTEFQSQ